jgi:homoserine dehydrogenase
VALPSGGLTTDAAEAIAAAEVVVELVGGTTHAKRFILEAIAQGKPVVTANKALLAEHGAEIFAAAARAGVDIYYEASVAGGIPIVKALREGLAANQVERLYGILNGTCNYILTRMEREKLDFSSILADAQALGYAEADPTLDVDGFDTAHKASILAALAYGGWFGMAGIHVEGIRGVSLADIETARKLGYRIKLLAVIKRGDGGVEIRVHPTMIPRHTPLADVMEVFNAVMVSGDFVGDTLFYGRGAGRNATASAVAADIVDVCLNLAGGCQMRLPCFPASGVMSGKVVDINDISSRYYLRMRVADKPGVVAHIAGILGGQDISISSLLQPEAGSGGEASLVILTHQASERAVNSAIAAMEAGGRVIGKVNMIRIEDI